MKLACSSGSDVSRQVCVWLTVTTDGNRTSQVSEPTTYLHQEFLLLNMDMENIMETEELTNQDQEEPQVCRNTCNF